LWPYFWHYVIVRYGDVEEERKRRTYVTAFTVKFLNAAAAATAGTRTVDIDGDLHL
jgi:hypothetical protein